MSKFFFVANYLAAGGIMHLIFIGATFDPTNTLGWIILLGWPAVAFCAGFLIVLVLALVCVLVVLLLDLYDSLPWVQRYRRRKIDARIRARFRKSL